MTAAAGEDGSPREERRAPATVDTRTIVIRYGDHVVERAARSPLDPRPWTPAVHFDDPAQRRFRIVVVCTANRIRSPLAAAFVRCLLDGVPVDVESAGTMDVGPLPPTPEALVWATRFGLDISSHRAAAIREGSLSDADLVLGFERIHVVTAVHHGGARPGGAFLLRGLVELLRAWEPVRGEAPLRRARRALANAEELRRERPRVASAEIPEPLGKPARVYEKLCDDLSTLSKQLVADLFGVSAG